MSVWLKSFGSTFDYREADHLQIFSGLAWIQNSSSAMFCSDSAIDSYFSDETSV
jgi:hypothetical protein